MDKNKLTNSFALYIFLLGYLSGNDILKNIGLFAISGAITNSLAIYMLFEKVPFLYGSGVIEDRFEEFKKGIYSLMMEKFFTKDNLTKFFKDELETKNTFNLTPIIETTDFSLAFESLKTAVLESPFGGMLGMFGGANALEPLKQPFETKLKQSIIEITSTKQFKQLIEDNLQNSNISDDIYNKLTIIVKKRLDELTPKMVKTIIQDMIKKHLGWLVVWGGVFGGLIGLLSSFLN